MMPALFDTCILIDYLNGIDAAANTFSEYKDKPAISSITWMEVMVGASKQGAEIERKTRLFLSRFVLFSVDNTVAEKAVVVRVEWGIKLPDAIIVATAQVQQRLLVTRNTKDFQNKHGVIIPYSL